MTPLADFLTITIFKVEGVMQKFESFVKGLANGLAFFGGLSVLLMMIQTVLDVGLNIFFRKPIEGNMEIISIYHMVLLVFLPLASVELKHEHINADLLVQTFSAKWRRITYLFGALITLIFLGLLMVQTWKDAIKSFEINEVVMGSVYVLVWPAKFSLPIGFFAMILVVIMHMVHAITRADFNPIPPDPADEKTSPAI